MPSDTEAEDTKGSITLRAIVTGAIYNTDRFYHLAKILPHLVEIAFHLAQEMVLALMMSHLAQLVRVSFYFSTHCHSVCTVKIYVAHFLSPLVQ
jgi:hypothetical protein